MKWEYKTIEMWLKEPSRKRWGFEELKFKRRDTLLPQLEATFNNLGNEGWECTGSFHHEEDNRPECDAIIWIFKRSIS